MVADKHDQRHIQGVIKMAFRLPGQLSTALQDNKVAAFVTSLAQDTAASVPSFLRAGAAAVAKVMPSTPTSSSSNSSNSSARDGKPAGGDGGRS